MARCSPTEETHARSASNTVAWFEIGAPDVEAAEAFYGTLFGWSFAPDGAYTLITAPGAAGPSGGIFNTGGYISGPPGRAVHECPKGSPPFHHERK